MHCGRFLETPLTRREMLLRCANGFGAVALSALLAEEGRGFDRTARGRTFPPAPATSSSCTWTAARRRWTPSTTSRCWRNTTARTRIPSSRSSRRSSTTSARSWPRRGSSAATAKAACGSATCSRTSPSASTTCASSARWSRSSPNTPAPTISCTPAPACRAGRAWAPGSSYGLGSLNKNLPGFIVLNGGLIPPGGLDNFNSGFLPAAYQGSIFRPADPPVANIRPPGDERPPAARQARPAPHASTPVSPSAAATPTPSSRPSPTTRRPTACRPPCRN